MPISANSIAGAKPSAALDGITGFPPPYWAAPNAALYLGDVRRVLRQLPTRSVHCAVTSPPYWGLRDYGTGTWDGGSGECDHKRLKTDAPIDPTSTLNGRATNQNHEIEPWPNRICGKCGARRVDDQIGLEDHPDCLGWATGRACGACYVCHMVEVFAEVRRVLRDDGTCWLNLGDSYGPSNNRQGIGGWDDAGRKANSVALPGDTGLENGNLIGVPWRVALALQANGWVLRQDIIWHALNKMPESVQNRCTKSHEHIFLLTKGTGYYYDVTAIAEPATNTRPFTGADRLQDVGGIKPGTGSNRTMPNGALPNYGATIEGGLKNKRDVWIVPTEGYPGAHFAVFSPRLITPCILAGTSEHGCCAACGRPYERLTVKERVSPRRDGGGGRFGKQDFDSRGTGAHPVSEYAQVIGTHTVGWRKACGCRTDEVAPCVVLDPFVGSGTTVATALMLGRAGVGIDLSETYLRENAVPRIEAALRGEKVRRRATVVVPADATPPSPRRLR